MEYIEGKTTNGDRFSLRKDAIECYEQIDDGRNIGVRIVMKSGAVFRTVLYDFDGLKRALET